MLDELNYAKKMLSAGNYTLFICSEEKVYFSDEKGIKPLLSLLSDDWSGAVAADRIVGKAAAMLYANLKVKAVYAGVMSESARAVFEKHGIKYEYTTLTENIINRDGTDLCPMELAVKDIDDPADAAEAISNKLAELSKNA